MGEIRSDQRIDALHTEAHIILSLHNYFLSYRVTTLELSQEKFAEFLQIGERSVQRVTKRLVDMGRLNRAQGQGQSQYIYSLPPNAVTDIMEDILFQGNLFPIYSPEGHISLPRSFDDLLKFIEASEQDEN